MKKEKRLLETITPCIIALLLIALLFWCNAAHDGSLFLPQNINAVLTNSIIQAFIAWAFAFIFASGYMDLSVGAIVVLAGFAAGELGNRFGYAGLLFGGLTVGVVLFSLNSLIFLYSKIPSWIAGLGLAMIYEGIGLTYSDIKMRAGSTVVTLESRYARLASDPYVYILFFIALILVYIIYNRSTCGFYLRAVGGDKKVSKAMGINEEKTIIVIALIAGVLIGMAGILNQSNAGRVFSKSGMTSLSVLFKPMASLFLAQVIQRRVNLVIAIPICSVIIYTLFNVLTILGVPSGTLQDAVLGLCMAVFGIVAQRSVKGVVK